MRAESVIDPSPAVLERTSARVIPSTIGISAGRTPQPVPMMEAQATARGTDGLKVILRIEHRTINYRNQERCPNRARARPVSQGSAQNGQA